MKGSKNEYKIIEVVNEFFHNFSPLQKSMIDSQRKY